MQTKQPSEPQVGQYLFASCKGQDYGKVIAIGFDENGTPCIDIELYDPLDLLDCDDDYNDARFPQPQLTSIELPPGTTVILRKVQWIDRGDDLIECRTPGNGCYRCTKLFSLRAERTKF